MGEEAGDVSVGSLRPPTRTGQLATLFWRKEVKLKMRRPFTTLCELLLPALLCASGIVGANMSEVVKFPEQTFAPANLSQAQMTVTPFFVLKQLGVGAASRFVPASAGLSEKNSFPGAIPDLSTWLLAAHFASSLTNGGHRLPPYDGTHLSIVPDSPVVREVNH